eukprot:1082268-Amphidinium_carterae.2
MSLVHQSDHVVLKDAVIMLVAFIEIGQFVAILESYVTMSDSVKTQRAVIGAVINTEVGESFICECCSSNPWRCAATVSEQTVSTYSFHVMIQIAFASHAIVTWLGSQSITESDVTVATGQDQKN